MAEQQDERIAPRFRRMNKKRKFVADGVFYAELNEFLTRELGADGYAGVEVRPSPSRTEVVLRATRTEDIVGDKGRRIREILGLIQQRWGFPEDSVEVFAERVENRGLSAEAQAENLRAKLLDGMAVRRAASGVIRSAMEAGAKGCEVIVNGKLRGQRAKGMKFREGYMIKTGQSTLDYVRKAVRHVLLRQGVIGLKVKIMLDYDETGENGVKERLADIVEVLDPNAKPAAKKPERSGFRARRQRD